MKRDEIIRKLKEREIDLRAQGVTHAALFGSLARGDERPDSDIDIMIELDPAARVTMFDYVDIKEYIEALFSEPVDVVNRDGLKPLVRPQATADAKRLDGQATADYQKLVLQHLTPAILRMQEIEATRSLAASPNSKLVWMNGTGDKSMIDVRDK